MPQYCRGRLQSHTWGWGVGQFESVIPEPWLKQKWTIKGLDHTYMKKKKKKICPHDLFFTKYIRTHENERTTTNAQSSMLSLFQMHAHYTKRQWACVN